MRYSACTIFVLSLALAITPTLAAAPGDQYWDGRFYLKSLDGQPKCLAVDRNGDVFVGGAFTSADNVVVNAIARWDGVAWHPLGDGLNSQVESLVFGPGGHLYAGGSFTDAGGDPDGDHIAVWNGVTWSSIGGRNSGLSSRVKSMAFDTSDNLYAGGLFADAGGDPDGDRIAVWDGSVWSSIGGADSGVGGNVEAIAISSSGTLVIGGGFTNAGGNPAADYIAGWNGSAWTAIGGGLTGWVQALAIASNGDLYVGGSFTDAGGDPDADCIAVWNSLTWSSLGGPGSGLSSDVRAVFIDGSGDLFAGGSFSNAGGDDDADNIARWTPSGWTSVGGDQGIGGIVEALAEDGNGSLVAAGSLANAGGYRAADYVATWDENRWNPMTSFALPTGSGLVDYVYALATDGEGRLYAGGSFTDAGDHLAADYFAVWDGSGWGALGGPDAAFNSEIYAIAFNASGDVIVGGDFTSPGGNPDADHIAIWDGVGWAPLNGPGGGLNGTVDAIVLGSDGRVYAGGDFSDAGGNPDADNIAVWDGAAWSALGGPSTGVGGRVHDLFFDGAGNLFAAGIFDDAGGDPDADFIAVWNGSSWASIGGPGSGLPALTYAVAVDDLGRVFVGGEFTDAGGDPDADYIAMWDGVSWNHLGNGLNDYVHDLVFDGAGNLYATGLFAPDDNGSTNPRRIAVWDGLGWADLGSGLEDEGFALTYDGGNRIFVGGVFRVAGDKASSRVGCYSGATPAGHLFADGFESGDVSGWSATVN